MTLDELIMRLTELKTAAGYGTTTVVLTAPVVDTDCWLHADQVTLEVVSEVDLTRVVRLQGGFGA